MPRIPLSLDTIQVASPCPVAWDSMTGDGRVRFCSKCEQRVYNLSEMPRKQAEALVAQAEGQRVCVRFYRRPDGTVMTRDCPIGVSAMRRRLAWVVGGVAAAFLFLLGWGSVLVAARSKDRLVGGGNAAQPDSDDQGLDRSATNDHGRPLPAPTASTTARRGKDVTSRERQRALL